MTKQGWVLINEKTEQPVAIGEKIVSFRGLEAILLGGSPPHKPSSSGKVWVENAEYYPSVFGLKWIWAA